MNTQTTILFLSLALIASVVFVVIEVRLIANSRRKRLTAFVGKQWGRVVKMISNEPKNAVIEADKLLQFALAIPHKRSKSVGDTLKQHGDQLFSDLNQVWRAHKLRNRLVHEIGFDIDEQDAREAVAIFRKALTELGVEFRSRLQ